MPKLHIKKTLPILLAWSLIAFLPFWLMFKTLGYNSASSSILVGGKYYSDFGSHLPLIRSFSFGHNWPPQLPLFFGEPIKYHYLFFAVVGFLEQIGVRIDFSLNIPSALGFSALAGLTWLITVRFTRSYWYGLIAVLFVFFNSSLSWLEFLKKYDLRLLPQINEFVGFRPWNASQIAPFWSLNIYSNQRHLGFSLAVVMLVVYSTLFKTKRLTYLSGFLTGSLLLINQAAAVICFVILGLRFVFDPKSRSSIILSSIGFFPWLFIYHQTVTTSGLPKFDPGFLADRPLGLKSFATFWAANTGPIFILGLVGMLAKRKYFFLLGFIVIFLLGYIFRLSPDIINNHKLFNFLIILCIPFSVWIISKFHWPSRVLLIPLMVLGGIVDFFPVKNDIKYALADIQSNPDAKYFLYNTPPQATVLNSTWFYHPASIAGRKIFNGYSYFTWSYGYDQVTREADTIAIYSAPDKATACSLIRQHSIDYVEISSAPESFIDVNRRLWLGEFKAVYTNELTGLYIIDASKQCL